MKLEDLLQETYNDQYEVEMIDKALTKVMKICDANLYRANKFHQLKFNQLRYAVEQLNFLLDQEGLTK